MGTEESAVLLSTPLSYMPSDDMDRVTDRKVRIVNLTGHPLELSNGWAFVRLESDGRVRVDSDMRMTERVQVMVHPDGVWDVTVPILDVNENTVYGLPDEEDGVLYVVSGIVASNVKGRRDVVSPGRVERDKDGNVKRARALIRVTRHD